jgi:hypothetical protein
MARPGREPMSWALEFHSLEILGSLTYISNVSLPSCPEEGGTESL